MRPIELAQSVVNAWDDPMQKILGHQGKFVAVATIEPTGPTLQGEAYEVTIYEMDDHTVPGRCYLGRGRVTIQRKDTDETTFLQAAAGALRAMR
jgi:hypothetical protein